MSTELADRTAHDSDNRHDGQRFGVGFRHRRKGRQSDDHKSDEKHAMLHGVLLEYHPNGSPELELVRLCAQPVLAGRRFRMIGNLDLRKMEYPRTCRRGGYGLVAESENSRPSVQLHRAGLIAIHCGSVRQGGPGKKKMLRSCQGLLRRTEWYSWRDSRLVCVGAYCTPQASFVLISFLKRSAASTRSPSLDLTHSGRRSGKQDISIRNINNPLQMRENVCQREQFLWVASFLPDFSVDGGLYAPSV